MSAPPPRPHIMWQAPSQTLFDQRVVAHWTPSKGSAPCTLGSGAHALFLDVKHNAETLVLGLYLQLQQNDASKKLTFYTIYPVMNASMTHDTVESEIDIPHTVKLFRAATEPPLGTVVDSGIMLDVDEQPEPVVYRARFHVQYAPRTIMQKLPAEAPERRLSAAAKSSLHLLKSLAETKDFNLFLVDRSGTNMTQANIATLGVMLRAALRKAGLFNPMPTPGQVWEYNIWEHYLGDEVDLPDTDYNDDDEDDDDHLSKNDDKKNDAGKKDDVRAGKNDNVGAGKKFNRKINIDFLNKNTNPTTKAKSSIPSKNQPHARKEPLTGLNGSASARDRHARKLNARKQNTTNLEDTTNIGDKRKRFNNGAEKSFGEPVNPKRYFYACADPNVLEAANKISNMASTKGTDKAADKSSTKAADKAANKAADRTTNGTKATGPGSNAKEVPEQASRLPSFIDEMNWSPDDGFEHAVVRIIPPVLLPGQAQVSSFNEIVGLPRPDQTQEIKRRRKTKELGKPKFHSFAPTESKKPRENESANEQKAPRLERPLPRPGIAGVGATPSATVDAHMTGTSFSGGGFAGYAAAGTGFHNAYNNNNDQSINNHHVHHNNTYTTNSNVGNINNGNPVFTGTQATHPFIATAQDIANNVMARASNTHVNSGTFRGALFAIAQRLARCWTVTALALPTGPAVAALTVQVRGVRDGSTVREGPDVGENADAANAGDEASFATETGMALAAMRAGSAARTGGVGNIGAENNNDGGTILQQAVQIGGSPTQQVVQIVDWIRRLISRQADMLILPDLVDLQTLAEMVERAAGTAGGAQVVGELRERYLELAAWCIILAIWRTG